MLVSLCRVWPVIAAIPILVSTQALCAEESSPATVTAPSVPASPQAKKPVPSSTRKPVQPKTTQKSTASKTEKPASPAKPKKPTVTRTIETQVSGFTSQDADQLYGRISLLEKRKNRDWFIRGSYSRTATQSGTRESYVTTSKVDSRWEQSRPSGHYNLWTGVLSRRDRDPGGAKSKVTRSGYYLLSYGFGEQLSTRMKGDIGLGVLRIYDNGGGTRPALVGSIRGRHPVSAKLAFDSDLLVIQPTNELRSTKVDSDIGLAYALADGLSLRLGWSANNLIRPVRGSHEWDSIIRLVIAYRHTSTH